MDEAIDARLLPGEGELPLQRLLAALPAGLALAPEQRSHALRERYPDAAARAGVILRATRSFLQTLGDTGCIRPGCVGFLYLRRLGQQAEFGLG